MNRVAKNALCGLYKYSGLMRAQEAAASWAGKSFMSIVLFHRVTDEIPEDGLTVSTAWFRAFCEMMQTRFRVVPLSELVAILENGTKPPPRTVALTFDDCYRDNLFAARTLAEFHLPATFFIPTRFVGTDHVFSWDQGLRPLANLNWDEVREMASLGHDIGSHTVSHPNMADLTNEEALRELVESRETLQDQLRRPIRYFAYPFGGLRNFRAEQLPLVREAGYDACFSGYGGFVYPNMRGKILPRDGIPYFRSLLNLEVHLTGCLDWMYALKKKVGLLT